ncbi:hypothetical protein AURANDRAFT_68543, partial [Aureococcus anophagefferens]
MSVLVQDISKAFDSVARRAGKELSLRRLAVPESVIDLFGQMDEGNRAVVVTAFGRSDEVVGTEGVFEYHRAAASVKTLILLACPVVSLLTASVAVLAEQDASRRALRAQALGRRRFATKTDIGRTWKSVTEIVEIESKADTDAWTGFVRAFLPAPLIAGAVASLSESSGQDAAVLASIVATAWGGFQVAVSFVACEYNLARGEESVAAKSRNAGIAEAYSAQAGKANAQVPYAHAISVLCVGTAALLVEAVPKILALPLPFISYAAVRRAAKYRSRTRGDAAAVAASADQLAGLQDGSDDDPLLPLKLTWQNFRGTVSATKKQMVFRVLVGALAAVGCVFGGSPAAVAGRGDAPAAPALRSLGVKVLAQRREPELRRLLASLDAADYPDAADISVEIFVLKTARAWASTWPHGEAIVVDVKENRGVRGAWLAAYDPSVFGDEGRRAVVFEDDVVASPACWYAKLPEIVAMSGSAGAGEAGVDPDLYENVKRALTGGEGSAAIAREYGARSKQISAAIANATRVSCRSPLQKAEMQSLTLDDLLSAAEAALPFYGELLQAIADDLAHPVEFLRCPTVKAKARASNKVTIKYGGDCRHVKDLVRGTFIFESLDSMYAGIEAIVTHPLLNGHAQCVVDFDDRWQAPLSGGYSDCQLLICIMGHLCELQVNVREMIVAKKGGGHVAYDVWRFVNEYLLFASIQNDVVGMRKLLASGLVTSAPDAIKDQNG